MAMPEKLRQQIEDYREQARKLAGIEPGKPAPDVSVVLNALEAVWPFDPVRAKRKNAQRALRDWQREGSNDPAFYYQLSIPGLEPQAKPVTPGRLIVNKDNKASTEGIAPPEFFEDSYERLKANFEEQRKAILFEDWRTKHYRAWYEQKRSEGVSVLDLTWPACVRDTLPT